MPVSKKHTRYCYIPGQRYNPLRMVSNIELNTLIFTIIIIFGRTPENLADCARSGFTARRKKE